ncbi:interferon a3-like [Synchiropus splendidus]|uniref:interferon a3-like n=1 Tax=Synchiropus splendidus TaxID=270530 RepID=UPI00237DFF59|nr:interferon a3-like [Synchiropus splendidus]
MANTSLNDSDNSDMVLADFPQHLYMLASAATDEHRLHFVVQVLDEVAKLFQEDHSSAAWGEVTVDHFLHSVTQQANGLRSCYQHLNRKNRRLHMYFKTLAFDLQQMEYSAEAWEMVRAAVKLHLFRAQLLVQPPMAGQ